MLHTNSEGNPTNTAAEALRWDEEFVWRPQGMTLADGDRKGTSIFFGDKESGELVLKPGFVVDSRNDKDLKAAIEKALGK